MTDDVTEFAPEFGDVGSWVQLPDGRIGQVWTSSVGCRQPNRHALRCTCPAALWVATGSGYVGVDRGDLVDPNAAETAELWEDA